MRMSRVLFAVGSVLVVACSAKTIDKGTVSGKVIVIGAPDNSNVLVQVGGVAGVTDASGNYSVEVAIGSYAVQYVDDATVEGSISKFVKVAKGANAQPDVVFTAQATPKAQLTGHMTRFGTGDGSAITVQLDPPNGPQVTTDATGKFTFSNVAGGMHSLKYSAAAPYYGDTIPSLLFVPSVGPMIVDAWPNTGVAHQFGTVELQAGYHSVAIDPNNALNSFLITPDGSRVVYGSTEYQSNGLVQIYSAPAAGGAPTLLATDLPWISYWKVSPDSQWLAYQVYSYSTGYYSLYTVPLAGGTPTQLLRFAYGGRFEWSPNLPAAGADPTIYAVAYDQNTGSTPYSLFEFNGRTGAAINQWLDVQPNFYVLPKVKKLIFGQNTPAVNTWVVPCTGGLIGALGAAYLLEGGSVNPVSQMGSYGLVWSDDQTLVAYNSVYCYSGGTFNAAPFPTFKVAPITTATPAGVAIEQVCVWTSRQSTLVPGVHFPPPVAAFGNKRTVTYFTVAATINLVANPAWYRIRPVDLSVGPNPTSYAGLVGSPGTSVLHVYSADGSTFYTIAPPLNPDGTYSLVGSSGNPPAPTSIGSFASGYSLSVAWTGNTVAFVAKPANGLQPWDLWIRSGTTAPVKLATAIAPATFGTDDIYTVFSRDGSRIYVDLPNTNSMRTVVWVPVAGGAPTILTTTKVSSTSFSNDLTVDIFSVADTQFWDPDLATITPAGVLKPLLGAGAGWGALFAGPQAGYPEGPPNFVAAVRYANPGGPNYQNGIYVIPVP